ncbi:hypothetical protein FVW59_15515 [Parahaliea aestuarii]|uniref:Type 4 fimbrial biogenesis protein PilX N-terminal domain-containing protein n=1 Tax=Parahaliea aestuarii TaxID=1852021 RepID=A0A5C8ZNR7_9GAMM|nr:hypothetical protein FVW59_15515 [Parahaliea aestuarii]
MPFQSPGGQRGAITILICLVMLILIGLMVSTAFSISTINLRSVANVQSREEAIAAANLVIERRLGADFTAAPAPLAGEPVDINNDGVSGDYLVDLATPVCVRAEQASSSLSFSVTLPSMTASSAWNTIWELQATATEPRSGASVRVVQGVRVLLDSVQKNARCPDV